MNDIVPPRSELSSLKPYVPSTHEAKIILAANESPFDLPQSIKDKIKAKIDDFRFNRYPDPMGGALTEKIAKEYGIEKERVILGNGSDELIEYLAIAYGGPLRSIMTFEPTFSMYGIIAIANGLKPISIRRNDSFDIDVDGAIKEIKRLRPTLIFICSPNNPTGDALGLDDIERIAHAASGIVVIDEAYGEFFDFSAASLLGGHENLVVLKTFSKAFSLASLRIGYMLTSKRVAANIQKVRLPFNTDAFSQEVAAMVFEERDWFKERVAEIKLLKDELFAELSKVGGIKPHPSKANFILFEAEGASLIHRSLLERGILIRDFKGDPILKDYLRVTVGSKAENRAFLEALFEITEGTADV